MENMGFTIDTVTISNFRGYFGQTTFSLFPHSESKKGIVLLGGPNGFGKTTVMDAIEWCLTGKVQRLCQDYDKRKETAGNKQTGLLKNSKANQKDKVSVQIKGKISDKNIIIIREFDGSQEYKGLSNEATKLKIISNNEILLDSEVGSNYVEEAALFNFDLSSSFYKRFVCSQEKNIQIYESGRKDFYQMFSGFLGGTEEINKIQLNLEGSKEQKVKGLIQQTKDRSAELKKSLDDNETQQKIVEEEIKRLEGIEKQDSGLLEKIKLYPHSLLYESELTAEKIDKNLSDTNQKTRFIRNQLQNLKTIEIISIQRPAYDNVKPYITELNKIIEFKNFEKYVYKYFFENKEMILSCQNKDQDNLVSRIKQHESLRAPLTKKTSDHKEYIAELEGVAQVLYIENLKELTAFNKKIEVIRERLNYSISLKAKLDIYSSTTKTLVALRALVDNIEGFDLYRKEAENSKCPLCGSEEKFANKNFEIAVEAKNVLGEIDKNRAELSKEFSEVGNQVETEIYKLGELVVLVINEIIKDANQSISNLEKVSDFKNACSKWSIDFNTLNEEILNRYMDNLKKLCEDQTHFLQLEKALINILRDETGRLIDVPSLFSPEDFILTSEFLELNERDKLKVITSFKTNFEERLDSVKLLMNVNEIQTQDITLRINILNTLNMGIENNAQINSNKQRKIELEGVARNAEALKTKNQKILDKLNGMLVEIKTIRTNWERDIASKVNQPLNYVYRRINRHNNYNKLIFQKPDRGNASKVEFDIEDSSGKKMFIPNVVSTGQLSTIAISSFLTIAMGQKDLPFRCYFMDDPIQSMDDINILSFIDLLRVELSAENNFIDQLYISTCDEDLEALILHKMKNFNINTTHFNFNGYGTYKMD